MPMPMSIDELVSIHRKLVVENNVKEGLVYMQISRGDLVLHLSEHHGDGSPGITVFVDVMGLRALHAEITTKSYNYLRPTIERRDWGADEMTLIDPFGNRLRLTEYDRKP